MQDGPTSVFEKQPRVILTTPRLILRTATEPDIKVMWERVLGDGDVMRYVFQGVPMTFERAGEVMRKFFTFGDTLTGIAILTEKSTAEIIGFAGLFPCAALGADDFEIGFVLARQAWGRGIATEIGEAAAAAVPALVDTCKERDPVLRRQAAIALGRIGPAAKSALPALEKAAHDEAPIVLLAAGPQRCDLADVGDNPREHGAPYAARCQVSTTAPASCRAEIRRNRGAKPSFWKPSGPTAERLSAPSNSPA